MELGDCTESEEAMLEFLPEDVRRGLLSAREKSGPGRHRMCVHVGDAVFPLLRSWPGGFAVDSARTPRLRGLVELFDGPRHLAQCLIVAASDEGGQTVYEIKRMTAARDQAARDYEQDEGGPAGYLPGPA